MTMYYHKLSILCNFVSNWVIAVAFSEIKFRTEPPRTRVFYPGECGRRWRGNRKFYMREAR